MSDIIFVSGLPCVGKTTYIRNFYGDRSKYFIFHFVPYLHLRHLYKDEQQGWVEMYNRLAKDAREAFEAGKSIVVELVNRQMRQEVIELLHIIGKSSLSSEWIEVTLNEGERLKREQGVKHDKSHYAVMEYERQTLEVLRDVVEDILYEPEVHTLMKCSSPNTDLELLCCEEKNGEVLFFALPSDRDVFTFKDSVDPEEDLEGVLVVERFARLDSVFDQCIARLRSKQIKFQLMEGPWKSRLREILYQYATHQKQHSGEMKAPLN